jgi:hypothetical protein
MSDFTSKQVKDIREAYLDIYAPDETSEIENIDEADSLAAMQARREKRLARQRKQMGTSSTGQDFGHNYGISSDERKKRQQAEFDKFVGKKTKKEEVEDWENSLTEQGGRPVGSTTQRGGVRPKGVTQPIRGLRTGADKGMTKPTKPKLTRAQMRRSSSPGAIARASSGTSTPKPAPKPAPAASKPAPAASRPAPAASRPAPAASRPAPAASRPAPAAAKPTPTAKPAPTKVTPTTTAATPKKQVSDLSAMIARSKARQAGKNPTIPESNEYTPYDIIMDYLFENGHVDTIEEAHYVMIEMDNETIADIIESMPAAINPAAHKAAQKKQKMYNLGKGTDNPNEAQNALKRTGAQLPGV